MSSGLKRLRECRLMWMTSCRKLGDIWDQTKEKKDHSEALVKFNSSC